MQPKLLSMPFAKNADASTKNNIPDAPGPTLAPQQATWEQGFPIITMQPPTIGGIPPQGGDFNGVLNALSEHTVYQNAGGMYKFSAELAAAIGGYSKGAVLISDNGETLYRSLVDNNLVNPNVSGVGAEWANAAADDSLRQDLADPNEGAALVAFESGSVEDVLLNLIPMANYSALRNYVGKGTGVRLTQQGIAGVFQRDDSDSTSTDNGGTIIIDGANRRWKRTGASVLTPGMFEIKSGDESSSYEALQRMFDAATGLIVAMPAQGVFKIEGTPLRIGDNTTIYWNNTTIHRDIVANNYGINVVGFGVTFNGVLNLTGAAERGWRISGDFCSFDDGVFVIGDTAGTGAGNLLKDALRIEPTQSGGKVKNTRGLVGIKNFDMGVCSKGASELQIKVAVDTYRTAVWLRDTDNFSLTGWAKNTSPTCTGMPGENAVLIEATSDFATNSGRIEMIGEDSGEHGFRVGGGYQVRDIWFYNSVARRTGRGIGTGIEPDSHGGCGFKVLGPTTTSNAYHRNIHFIGCVAEDVRVENTENDNWNNFDGFSIGKTINASLINPVVKRSNHLDASAPSCLNGIHVYGSRGVQITNPRIEHPSQHGIFIDELPNSPGVNFGNFNEDIFISGGSVGVPVGDCVRMRSRTLSFRRMRIDGLQAVGGKASIRYIPEGGSAVQCSASMICLNPSENISLGTAGFRMQLSGTLVGLSEAAGGSTFQDWNSGDFMVRKPSGWVPV